MAKTTKKYKCEEHKSIPPDVTSDSITKDDFDSAQVILL